MATKNNRKSQQSRQQSIYSRNLLQKDVKVNITFIGSNISTILQETLSQKYEGKCSKEGYIKRGSIRVVNYSAGVLESDYAIFSVSFECLICHPVEGMQIKCKIYNVTKAGIRASYYNNIESPLIVFVARDHYYNDPIFVKIKEEDIITIKVIGTRFELNDDNVYIIGELIKLKQKKEKINKSSKNRTKKNKK